MSVLPWLNLLLIPILGYVLSIERRLTRLEAIREAEQDGRIADLFTKRRAAAESRK